MLVFFIICCLVGLIWGVISEVRKDKKEKKNASNSWPAYIEYETRNGRGEEALKLYQNYLNDIDIGGDGRSWS